ncbi:MAG: patatin-like phospholipase family protein [Deltaproteobacteria bacterium]|nr:patatin-like phospholipase family protein [Deltaproteobacteria bacterium]
MTGSSDPPGTALVLAGGGALGAYEAGVAHYLLDGLPRERKLRRPAQFDVFTGTSVGAINASFLAAGAHDPARSARDLVSMWRSVTFDKVLRFGSGELGSLFTLLMGDVPGPGLLKRLKPRPQTAPHPPVAGLFDTSPLRNNMGKRVDWDQLADNFAAGAVRGLAVCATEACTGMAVVFYQTDATTSYKPGRDPNKRAEPVHLGLRHALASAAIPFLFPAVQIDGVCYTDGALRQNTPLNPAMRMGADRIVVVSLSQRPSVASRVARLGCRRNRFPGALFLLGKTVGILLTQTLDYELQRVDNYNRLIRGGTERYGPEFAAELNGILGQRRNASYRPIRTCHIRPSEDLNLLAMQALTEAPDEVRVPGLPGRVISRLLRSGVLVESGLLSMLMFTPTFVHKLLDLGYRDARAQQDDLVALFAD